MATQLYGDLSSPQLRPENAKMEPKVPIENVNNLNISSACSIHFVRECCNPGDGNFRVKSRYKIAQRRGAGVINENASGPTRSGQNLEIDHEKVSVGYGCSHCIRGACRGCRSRCASLHQGPAADDRRRVRLERLLHRRQRRLGIEPQVLWISSPLAAHRRSEGCHDRTGGVVGGQIGYRWQASQWVFGLEAQGDWADLRGSRVSLFDPTLSTRVENSTAFGLFTGQIG